MVEAVVEYDYDGQEDDELTLRIGDTITDINKLEGGWWEGILNGKKGVFPDNFVKEHTKEKEKPKEEAVAATKPSSHVAKMAGRLDREGGIKMGPATPPGKRDSIKRKKVKVAYSYNPANDDELKLEVGDIIEVVKEEEESWWEGLLNGKQGMFPTNFVEDIAEEKEEEVQEIKGKKPKGPGFGNIFSQGPIQLKRTSHIKSTDEPEHKANGPEKSPSQEVKTGVRKSVAPPVPREPPALPPKETKHTERAKVLYSYEAENEDELSMEAGDIITILDKELEDAGWWKGEINGRMGVFPDNFVELLVVEDKPKKPPPPTLPSNKAKQERPPPPDPTKIDQSRTYKKDDHKEEKPAKPSVPPLGKKPSAPPPVGKKPLKGADPKLIAQTDDHKAKEQKGDSFDSVESTSEKLNHVTRDRVKVPSVRRPPSTRKDEANDPLDTVVKEDETIAESPPATSHDKRRSRSKRLSASPGEHRDPEAKTEESKVPSTRSVKAPPPVPRDHVTPPVASTRPVSMTRSVTSEERVSDESRAAASTARIDQLQKELDQIKETHVKREQYEELQGEVKQLKQAMDQMKSQFTKRLFELMGEIDEEKKIRLSTQVEIDRLKTLVRS